MRNTARHIPCSIDNISHLSQSRDLCLAKAKDFAEDWYLNLRGKIKMGEAVSKKTFAEAAEQFLKEYTIITGGQHSPRYVQNMELKLRHYLLPFFGGKGLSKITAGLVQEFRVHRQASQIGNHTHTKRMAAPSRHPVRPCIRKSS